MFGDGVFNDEALDGGARYGRAVPDLAAPGRLIRPYDGVRFDGLTMRALHNAYRAARRAGAPEVGTDDVLIGLCGVPEYVRACGTPVRAATIQEWRRRSRSGLGADGDGSTPPGATPDGWYEVEGALRETRWRLRRRWPFGTGSDEGPEWTAGVRFALADALAQAYSSGMSYTNALQVFVGLLRNPEHRAALMLFADAQDPMVRMAETRKRSQAAIPGTPPLPDVPALRPMLRGPVASGSGSRRGHLPRRLVRAANRRLHPGSVPAAMADEQKRYAVRLGQQTVAPHHLLIAILETDRALTALGWSLRTEYASRNTAAALLRAAGIRSGELMADALRRTATARVREAGMPAHESASTRGLAAAGGHDATVARRHPNGVGGQVVPAQRRRTLAGDPLPGPTVSDAYRRAKAVSQQERHPYIGTTHVLASLLDDSDGETAALLARLGHDPADLAARAWYDLGTRRR